MHLSPDEQVPDEQGFRQLQHQGRKAEDLEEIKGRLTEAALAEKQTRDGYKPEGCGQAGSAVERSL